MLSLDIEVFLKIFIFWKNFDFFKVSLEGLDRMGGGILTTSACFPLLVNSTLLLGFLFVIFGVNLEVTFCLNILLRLLALENLTLLHR